MQVLEFFIDAVRYGVALDDVDQVLEMAAVETVSNAPDFMTGALNLGGALLPVVDLTRMLGHVRTAPPSPRDDAGETLSPFRMDTRLLAVKPDGKRCILMILDGFKGIRDLERCDTAVVRDEHRPDYINGLSVDRDTVIQIIRLKQVLTPEQLAVLT
ncbi:MAG: chemotaxis protein CheW [Desulfobacterales bacterium]|nr:chemotaxis protein CheW [Desulfobacterales bacterium]